MIVVVKFVRPIDVPVDKLWEGAPDFVSSARVDPDGSAIRLALARKATPNVMVAGERLFIDLLPDTWSGPPPSLPPDVIKELAERAKEAERLLRQHEAARATKKRPPIRVRASTQPTFTRYVFELPDGAGVSTILNKERLTLNFDSGLTFDLADAKVATAPNISAITQKVDGESTVVEFALLGDADVHSFREERSYVVDIGFAAKQESLPKLEAPKPETQPATVPAAAPRASEIKSPTSQDIIKEAGPAPAAPLGASPPRAGSGRSFTDRSFAVSRAGRTAAGTARGHKGRGGIRKKTRARGRKDGARRRRCERRAADHRRLHRDHRPPQQRRTSADHSVRASNAGCRLHARRCAVDGV